MYGIRPSRYTLDEIVAECANAIRNVETNTNPQKIVWSCAEGRYVFNPDYVTVKHGRLQEVA
jgi:hypothetical protein